MAARFGATIIPFGVVGEDDISQVSVRTSALLGTFFFFFFSEEIPWHFFFD